MVRPNFSPMYLELLKDRQEIINRFPHLKVLHYQIHEMEQAEDSDAIQVALDINRLLVSHLRADLHPEVDEFLKKYKGRYFLSIDRPVQPRALYPAISAPVSVNSKKASGE